MSRAVTDEILTHLTISGLFTVVSVAQPFQTIRQRNAVSRAVIDKILTTDNVNFNSCRSFQPIGERIVVPRTVIAKIFTDIHIKF